MTPDDLWIRGDELAAAWWHAAHWWLDWWQAGLHGGDAQKEVQFGAASESA